VVCPCKRLQPGKPAPKCNKKGGFCSLRQFVKDEKGGVVAERGMLHWSVLETDSLWHTN
jgi:hypothetical protein